MCETKDSLKEKPAQVTDEMVEAALEAVKNIRYGLTKSEIKKALAAAFSVEPAPQAPAPETHVVGSPVAWRYRHVPIVGWSYSDSKHPREDMEQEPLYGPETVGLLREALARMENCCEQLAATRSMEVYSAMIDGGQAQALLDLDNARRNARAALAPEGRA